MLNPLPKVSIRGPRGELSACRGKTEGREGQRKAAHDVAAARRRMALATVTVPGLKIVQFLVSEIFSGQRNVGIWITAGLKCRSLNFGP